MSKKQKQITAGLISAAGAITAFIGVRWLIRRLQQRAHDQEYSTRAQRRLVRREGMPGIAMEEIGSSHQPQAQPDRQPIPATGVSTQEISAAAREMVEQGPAQPAVVEMSDLLAQYLLSFESMIGQLHTRRQESGNMDAEYSLSVGDRARIQEALDRLEEQIMDYGSDKLIDGSLQERIYRLMFKVHNSLTDPSYSDADLFRINGEVRSEACRILKEIQDSGAVISPDLAHVRLVYECEAG